MIDSQPPRPPGRKRRPGGGRKPKGASRYAIQIPLRVTAETAATLAAWAEMEGVDRTDLIRRAIDQYFFDKQFI